LRAGCKDDVSRLVGLILSVGLPSVPSGTRELESNVE
jgi:hypothetical protein